MQFVKLFAVCFIMLGVIDQAHAQLNLDYYKKLQIQEALTHWRAHAGIPSATLSILFPNEIHPITITSGSITPTTLFQAGSITKSFTAAIILKLQTEGKLKLNQSITTYLPQYPRWRSVTIRQLLNHTSGIFNYTQTSTFNKIRKHFPRANFTPEEIVAMASQHRDYFPPGKGWKYSNTNYVLAGMIIQKVTHQKLEAVMNHYLHNDRLNLPHTFYLSHLYTSNFIARMARGYSVEGYDVTQNNMSWANAAGAIVTTPDDLLTWWKGLFQNRVLSSQGMNQMMSLVCERSSSSCRAGANIPHLSAYEFGKGYGLGIIQSAYGSDKMGTVWWHNGSTKGYKAIVMWYPKRNLYMALMINRDPGYLLKPSLPAIQRILKILA